MMDMGIEISIHALREEGDVCFAHMIFRLLVISIHALREEGDQCTFLNRRERQHFYPRPPRGGRPGIPAVNAFGLVISIHALREEGDTIFYTASVR